MKKLIVLPLALGFLVGCSSNTPYVDKEFGQASKMAFESQIADQTYRHVDKVPEGIGSLPAEKIMEAYTKDFSKRTTDDEGTKPFQSNTVTNK